MDLVSKNLERIINSLDKGFYYVDRERRVKFWSKKAELITGYEAHEVLESVNVLKHEDENGKRLCLQSCPLLSAMTNHTTEEMNVLLRHKDGDRIPVNVKVIPIFDNRGGAVGAVEIFDKIL